MCFDRKKSRNNRKITGRDYVHHLCIGYIMLMFHWRVPFSKPPLIHHDGKTSGFFSLTNNNNQNNNNKKNRISSGPMETIHMVDTVYNTVTVFTLYAYYIGRCAPCAVYGVM